MPLIDLYDEITHKAWSGKNSACMGAVKVGLQI